MKKVFTEKAPAAIGPYSQAVVTGGKVFASGQIPINPETGILVNGNIVAQTEQVIHNIAAVLESAGSDFDHVIKTTCFLTDMADFTAFNEVYGKYFTGNPARSCVAVSALPKGAGVEVELIAEIANR